MVAYDEAIFVPIAVPLSCLENDRLCSKMLFLKTHSANSIRNSVKILLSFRKSRAILIAINTSLCGILGYRPTTFILHSITSELHRSTQ